MSASAELGKPAARSPYIAGPVYDWVFFLLPPAAALLLGALLSGSRFSDHPVWFGEHFATAESLFLGALVNAHLVAVVFRSHANPAIFKLHRARFIAAPLALFAAMMASLWVMISVTVLVVFWDVYHSGLQTFGLARIYDRNRGNDPSALRGLDLWLNHILYAGPIVGGAVMLAHFNKFELFDDVGAESLAAIPSFMKANQPYFRWALLAAGAIVLAAYVASYARLARRGYKVSKLKLYLLVSTGICSVWSWGFNAFGEAFFIMNFFHAVQYLGLVWWTEGDNLRKLLRVDRLRLGRALAGAVFVGFVLTYGVWAQLQQGNNRALWCVTQVVSVMHFWYDGFVWSVRRRQI